MGGFTPGPWVLTQHDAWNFPLRVVAPGGEVVVNQDRWAHSTQQKTLADCMEAVGFPHKERAEVVARLERQVADMNLIAAAPEMFEALKLAEGPLQYAYHNVDSVTADRVKNEILPAIRAALAKASPTLIQTEKKG